MSNPVLVMGSDFNRYILKNEEVDIDGNKQNFNCMFLNELLACKIGEYLNVPIPEPAIARIDRRLIDNSPVMRFTYRFKEGCYFASEELSEVENNLMENMSELMEMRKPYIVRSWNVFFDNIINKKDIAKILAFDILIGNFDRYTNEGNILISLSDKGRRIYAIDHGHAFWGPTWNQGKINHLNNDKLDQDYIIYFLNSILKINQGSLNGLGTIFRALESHVDLSNVNQHDFIEIVHNIESIDEEFLDDCFKEVPDSWFINKPTQIALYKKFILNQKNMIRHIIQELAKRGAFTNFRGGALEWKKEKQYGTA
ncbi:hypothetical protein D3Z33_00005 [Senegalia massiliensis]|uniref:PI3K/PI4K catalytic domain-containing protein n=2 Tax=Senegalia massiliensis TaxID=1720316 RepID=A0A845QRS7_9CLOT|nr:hypothetical protein [Senegalia massiliensis]